MGGVPWDKAIAHGEEVTDALPRAIMPEVAIATVYTFEPSPIRADRDLEQHALMVCLVYEVISSEGKVIRTRSPIGIVKFSNERIEDIIYSEEYRSPVTIIP